MSEKIGGLVCTFIGFEVEHTSDLPYTEEILIDFKELIGEYSGEKCLSLCGTQWRNMA
jgi:hypothetical protein